MPVFLPFAIPRRHSLFAPEWHLKSALFYKVAVRFNQSGYKALRLLWLGLCGAAGLTVTTGVYAQADLNALDSIATAASVGELPAWAAPDTFNALPVGFIERADMAKLPKARQKPIPAACRGIWYTPFAPMAAQNRQDPTQESTVITADYGYYHPTYGSELSGSVRIAQPERLIYADKIALDGTQTIAHATGHVRLAQNGLWSEGETLHYNLQTQTGSFGQSQFISEALQAHGTAGELSRTDDGMTHMVDVQYSTCEPAHQVWQLRTHDLLLNPTTGQGTAKKSTLYIKDIPVLSVPWFRFPIDDRRMSGFLVPSGGYTNDGGLMLSVPYYFNLAPNYDATLTPRLLSHARLMLEGQARFLDARYGQATVSGGYLPHDSLNNAADRKQFELVHDAKITPQLSSHIDLNYLSDKNYYTDLGTDPLSTYSGALFNPLYQPRTFALNYANGIKGLTATLQAQTFQNVDPSTPDANRPYSRLPQLKVAYVTDKIKGWQYTVDSDAAYFKKSISDGSAVESSGGRFYNQMSARYQWKNPYAFVTPEFSLRTLVNSFDRATQVAQHLSSSQASHVVNVPQFTLDSGLTLEKQGSFLQTLEPRIFYTYAPYRDQSAFTNFETVGTSLNFDQLFTPYRFVGHDRIEDNNTLSLGLTHRLFGQDGLELLRASVGSAFYLQDRKVRLQASDPINTARTSGLALMVSSQFKPNWRIETNTLWQPSGSLAQSNTQLMYNNSVGQMYQVGYIHRAEVASQNQAAYQQATFGMIQPLRGQWRALGLVQYDFNQQVSRDLLLGVDYEGCCWRMALYARRYYNPLDEVSNSKVHRLIMAEFSLKGLAGLSGNLSKLLQQNIFGYTQADSSWKNR